MATNLGSLNMPDAVTVLVSTQLLDTLTGYEWSPPVQLHIDKTPGVGSGYEMICRTHDCDPHAVAVVHGGVDSEAYARIWNQGYAEAQRQADEADAPTPPDWQPCTTATPWGECVLANGHETHDTEGPGMQPTTAHVDRWGKHWGVAGANN